MAKYDRPSAGYTPTLHTAQITKYQTDSQAVPKVAISSVKVDGDINKVFDAVNELWLLDGGGSEANISATLTDQETRLTQAESDILSIVSSGVGSPTGANTVFMSKDGSTYTTDKVDTAQLAADAVDNTILAAGTAGSIRSFDSSGDPTDIAPSATTGLPLVSAGTGAEPTYGALVTAGVADNAITEPKVSDTILNAFSAITTLQGADQVPIADNSDGDVNRKITVTNFANQIANGMITDELVVAQSGGTLAGITARSTVATGINAQFSFDGQNDAAANTTYSRITSTVDDDADGSEDSTLGLQTNVAGTLADRLKIGAGLYTAGATGGDQGADTFNAAGYFINGVPFGADFKLLTSGTMPAGDTIDFDSANGVDPTNYPTMLLVLSGLRGTGTGGDHNTGLLFSDDDGATFKTTGYDSGAGQGFGIATTTTSNEALTSGIMLGWHSNLVGDTWSGAWMLHGFGSSTKPQVTGISGGHGRVTVTAAKYDTAMTTNAFRVEQDFTGGNGTFSSTGKYYLYGLKGA